MHTEKVHKLMQYVYIFILFSISIITAQAQWSVTPITGLVVSDARSVDLLVGSEVLKARTIATGGCKVECQLSGRLGLDYSGIFHRHQVGYFDRGFVGYTSITFNRFVQTLSAKWYQGEYLSFGIGASSQFASHFSLVKSSSIHSDLATESHHSFGLVSSIGLHFHGFLLETRYRGRKILVNISPNMT